MYVNKIKQQNKTTTNIFASRAIFKITDVVKTMISNILHDLRFSLNQSLKSADKWYIEILQNVIKTYEYLEFFFSVILNFPFGLTR